MHLIIPQLHVCRGGKWSRGDARRSSCSLRAEPCREEMPCPPFTLWLIRRGPQAAEAWLTGTSDERLLIRTDLLLLYGNVPLKNWNNKRIEITITVFQVAAGLLFCSFYCSSQWFKCLLSVVSGRHSAFSVVATTHGQMHHDNLNQVGLGVD